MARATTLLAVCVLVLVLGRVARLLRPAAMGAHAAPASASPGK